MKFFKRKPQIPAEYNYLLDSRNPKIIREALKLYGVKEEVGVMNNPEIMGWAKEIGGWIGDWYNEDKIPWCGLFMAVVAKRAGFSHNQTALSALKWRAWGQKVLKKDVALGDVVIFKRKGGGHVGIYVGEDHTYLHVLGGNQSDAVNIIRINKNRLHAVRRCKWKWSQPTSVRKVFLSAKGQISFNEV